MKLGVVGFGYVGTAIWRFFRDRHPVAVYDKYREEYSRIENRNQVNASDLVFVAVPTPSGEDGWTCDCSAITEVLEWVTAPICIKSTIPPGSTDIFSERRTAPVCFSPEYIGEGPNHPWQRLSDCGFVIVGGTHQIASCVEAAYKSVDPQIDVIITNARTAELCKYMENSYLACKVSFVNQFYDIANYHRVDFDELVSLWLRDERIGRSHCSITNERGFDGKCLPKDLRAIIASTGDHVSTQLLRDVVRFNEMIRGSHKRE